MRHIILLLLLPAGLWAKELRPFWEIEPRVGVMRVCGTCRKGAPWDPTMRGEVQLQSIQPLFDMGAAFVSGGGYLRAGGFEKSFQGAGGFLGELRFFRADVRPFLGLCYSDRRITDAQKGYRRYPGQTRHTYDVGLSFGWRASEKWRLSLTYTHNSNGQNISLNPLPGLGGNPGLDSILLGVAYKL